MRGALRRSAGIPMMPTRPRTRPWSIPGPRSAAVACALAALLVRATPALAHEGRPVEPHDLWSAWTFEPGVVVPLVVTAVLYGVGLRRLWSGAGVGRGVRRWEAACFAGGWLSLAVALVSPLHTLGGALFSAHMAQHEVLMALAAPLLVLGRPLVPWTFALPRARRSTVGGWAKRGWVRGPWRAVSGPGAAWTLHAAALWLWHMPLLYGLALRSEAVHGLQHACFLGTALLFWWALLRGRGARLGYGAAVLYLFTTAAHSGALGALLTFARSPWYPGYAATTAPWGLTALEDQQLAGLIMWVPAGAAYLVAALWLFAEWLRESERRTLRREARLARLEPTAGEV
jgi:putative membrane protein